MNLKKKKKEGEGMAKACWGNICGEVQRLMGRVIKTTTVPLHPSGAQMSTLPVSAAQVGKQRPRERDKACKLASPPCCHYLKTCRDQITAGGLFLNQPFAEKGGLAIPVDLCGSLATAPFSS